MERLPPDTPWMTAPSLRAVIDALEAAGGEGCARFVGGCVRDTLLGRGDAVTDVDIATPLTPPEVVAALQAAGLKSVPTGIEHGTITAISEGRPYEITTLRRDVETDGRRAVVAFTTSWEEDAQRRDFRLNALYADPDGTIHDPTGGGLDDVRARRIVFVGDPETRIREDYLRILRFFRFLARVGDAFFPAQADPTGLYYCSKLTDGIATLSGERIQAEMFKLLAAADPYEAIDLMQRHGILSESVPNAAIRQDQAFGGILDLQRRYSVASDPVLRLATLISDVSAEQVLEVADRLRLSRADRERLRALGDAPSPREDMTVSEARRLAYFIGSAAFRDRLVFEWAHYEYVDPLDPRWRALLDVADWSPPPFPVTGAEIKALGVPEGPQVGAVRKALEEWWVAGDFSATKAEALERLEEIVRKLG